MKQYYYFIILFFTVINIQAQFIFKVETTTANESFTIPIKSGESYKYQLVYTKKTGELPIFKSSTGSETLTFEEPGIHTVQIGRIPGDFFNNSFFPAIYFNNSGDKDKIVSIEKWGDTKWTTMEAAFKGCSNLVLNASDAPDLSLVTNMTSMFEGTTNLEDLKDNIGNWNTGFIENLTSTFKSSGFNENINNWNVSNVRFMDSLFEEASNFNQPVNNWATTSLEFANGVFKKATNFNQELSNWDMSLVQEVGQMFLEAEAFDQNLGSWDISSMKNMTEMFFSAELSTTNYDNTIKGWATLDVGETKIPTNINFYGGSGYCNSLDEHLQLRNAPYNWVITDRGLICPEEDKFITTWKTNADDLSGIHTRSITIPTDNAYDYYYSVDWGDGIITNDHTGNATHEYVSSGTYQIKIYGKFPALKSGINGSFIQFQIQSVDQWGSIAWETLENAFFDCKNLDVLAIDSPDLSKVTNLSNMFFECNNLGKENAGVIDLSNWNTTTITDMSGMFFSTNTLKRAGIGNWNVGSITNFNNMFFDASVFNENLNNWNIGENVSGTINLAGLFSSALKFNSPLHNWDVSKVDNFTNTLRGTYEFDQDLSSWDISSGTTFSGMLDFSGISVENYDKTLQGFAALDAGETKIPTNIEFGASNVGYGNPAYRDILKNTYSWTFEGDVFKGFEEDKFITTWQVAAGDLTIPIYMFGTANDYTVDWGDGTIESGFTGNTTHTYTAAGTYTVKIYGDFSQLYFFNRDGKEKIRSIEQWGTNKWTGLDFSFYGCANLELNADDVPDLSEATAMTAIFQNATAFTDARDKLKEWDVSTITSFDFAFQGTAFNRNISGWNMEAAESINHMFDQNTVFNQPIGSWTFNNLKQCSGVFRGATSFNQDLSNWDVSKVDIFSLMFKNATSFDQSLGAWDISAVNGANGTLGMDNMFENAGLSIDNYDATLLGWATLDAGETQIPTNLTFHGGNSNYCISANARSTLQNDDFKWNIIDGGLLCNEEDKFISIWKTTNNNESIQIRTTGATSTFEVDWGDGTSGISNSHTYAVPGTYTVKVSGTIGQLYANNQSVTDKMQSVEQWGASKFTSFRRAFAGADNVVINATDIPDLSNVTSMESAFSNCKKLVDNGGQMKNWNVSTVENFTGAFQGASSFNENLGNWDLSSATTLSGMLNGTGIGIENYDATLIGWAANSNTPNGLTFSATGVQYCTAEAARTTLDIDKTWNINDGGLGCAATDFFITTWETRTVNESITIPTTGSGYNYNIDWGDGTVEIGLTGNATHEYLNAGTYTVKINGEFPMFTTYISGPGGDYMSNAAKLKSIEQWGTQQWTSMQNAFDSAVNLVINATDTPDLSIVTNMSGMFFLNSNLADNGGTIENWDVSNVKDMSSLFANTPFNKDISSWDTHNVTNMSRMFFNATNFDQNLGDWDISKVTNMEFMFDSAGLSTSNYDNTLIGWATDTSGSNADGIDDIPSNINFNGGSSIYCLGQKERSKLDNAPYNWTITDGGINASCDFAKAFITTWQTTTANESIIISTLGGGYNYNIDWGDGTISYGETGDTSHIYTAPGIHTIKIIGDFPRYNPSKDVTNAAKLKTVEQWGAIQWQTMHKAFASCVNMDITATDAPDLSNVLDMYQMFYNCTSLTSPDLSNWDTSRVTNMFSTFLNANQFNGNITTWNVGNVMIFNLMLSELDNFNQDISGWNIGENTMGTITMNSMFSNSSSFDQNLGTWNLEKVVAVNNILDNTALSITNYDATLIGWVANANTPNGLTFGAEKLKYCFGETARNTLTAAPYNWTINDGGLGCLETEFFITTWKTITANETITIPTSGAGYNYAVDWGDGMISTNVTSSITHKYDTSGIYTVKIIGDFPRIVFGALTDEDSTKLQTVEQWGSQQWESFSNAFIDCFNLKLNADDVPNLSQVTSMYRAFKGCTNLEDLKDKINTWNVANVTSFGSLFEDTSFNENINNWNVSNVEGFSSMFKNNTTFNQPLNNWNTEKANDFANMFEGAISFNQDLGNWDTALVHTFDFMFLNASSFNQNLGSWDISNTSSDSMDGMLTGSAMSQSNYDATLIGWATLDAGESQIPVDVKLDTDATYCLASNQRNILTTAPYNWTINDAGLGCETTDFFITTWETTTINETVTIPTSGSGYSYTVDWGDGTIDFGIKGNATHEFSNAGSYIIKIIGDFPRIHFDNSSNATQIKSIEQWGTIAWTSMEDAFRGCTNLVVNATDSPDLSNVTNMSFMFGGCRNLGTADFSGWNTSNVSNMRSLFGFARFNGNIGNWNVGRVTSFNSMFRDNTMFNQDISGWNIGEFVTGTIDMTEMFRVASNFNQSLNNWNVSKVNNMHGMFQNARKYNQPMNLWNVANTKFMNEMFLNASRFDQDLSSWNISSVTTMKDMLIGTVLSQENYDLLLINWSEDSSGIPNDGVDDIPTNLELNVNATYCFGISGKNKLKEAPYNWNIIDNGTTCTVTDFFITTWQTTSNNESITIPTTGDGYDYSVDWGDGTIEKGLTGDATHEYANAGMYTVKIKGNFSQIYFNNQGDKHKITAINQWGTVEWRSMLNAFFGCINLEVKATDIPNLSSIDSLRFMFRECRSLDKNFDVDFSGWDTSDIVDFSYMFAGTSEFNSNSIVNWDVGNGINFNNMFNNSSQFNQDLSNWNLGERVTSSITLKEMFFGANQFNQSLEKWNISLVRKMNGMLTTSGMSQFNYDATLIGWARLDAGETQIPTNLTLGANATYCLGKTARNILTSAPYNWMITDGGLSNTCNLFVWNGNSSSVWTEGANWNGNTAPTSTDDIIIPNVATTPEITTNVQVNDLEIESLASFDISSDGSVIVDGDFTNSGNFTITSNTTNSGTLVTNGSVTGNVTYERGGLKANVWSIVSAPVSGQSIKDFVENASNDIRKNTIVTPNLYTVGYYDDSKAAGSKWVYYDVDYLAANPSVTFESGRSYAISRATDGVLSFTGTVATADVPKAVTASEWNAVGNPYTAFMPINENSGTNFISTNAGNLDAAYVGVYVWDNTQNKYVAKSLVTDEASLAPGQGFFVKTGAGVSTIDFNEAQRMVQPLSGGDFSRNTTQNSGIVLSARTANSTVTTTLKYLNTATEGLDPGYDLGNHGGASFDVYTRLVGSPEAGDFTIQSLPSLSEKVIIPVGLRAAKNSKITFTVSLDNLANITVFIEDKVTGNFTKLNDSSYEFTTTEKMSTAGRFYLHVQPKQEEVPTDLSAIKIYTATNHLIVSGIQKETFTVRLFTIQGREILSKTTQGTGVNKIALPSIPTGIYVVKLTSELGEKSSKVIIK